MLKYNIVTGSDGGRVVIVKRDDLQRWALHDEHDTPLVFKPIGTQAIAVVHGDIRLYKKPSEHSLHYEYIRHNARALWLGLVPQFDTLARDNYDYEGTI